MKRISLVILQTFTFASLLVSLATLQAQSTPTDKNSGDGETAKLVEKAAENAVNKQKFLLQYKFKAGDEIRWNVEHTTSTKTQMAGESEETSSRTQTTKKWNVLSAEPQGNFQFEHMIESLMLWQKIGDEAPIVYDSQQPEKGTPPEFQEIKKSVGTVVSTITARPDGQIINRKSEYSKARLGVGEILVPLPDKPIAIGHQWAVPTQLQVEDENGLVQNLSARVLHELEKVVEGKAYISIRTEILTPVESDKIRSQIMQQMSSGYAVLDLERGLIVFKELDWNEKVQGFEGNDSLLQYMAKLTEKIVNEENASSKKPTVSQNESVEIKPRDGKPIMRK
jgi:hypothetical protein